MVGGVEPSSGASGQPRWPSAAEVREGAEIPTSRTARRSDQQAAAAAGPKPPDEPPSQERLAQGPEVKYDFSDHNTWSDEEIKNWNEMLEGQGQPPITRTVRPPTMPSFGRGGFSPLVGNLDAAPRAPQAKRQPKVRKLTQVLPAVIGVKEEVETEDEMGPSTKRYCEVGTNRLTVSQTWSHVSSSRWRSR